MKSKKINAYCTRKREIENYLHIDLLKKDFPNLVTIEDYEDIKELTTKKVLNKNWKNMSFQQFRERETYIENGIKHYELTEIIQEILSLVS